MTELLVLEHTPAAGASAFVEVLDARRSIAPWRRIDVPAGEPLPHHLDEVAGILVMGGIMSAVEPDEHDWMLPEIALLRRAVEAEVPSSACASVRSCSARPWAARWWRGTYPRSATCR
jgi:hypothetical protein